MARFWADANGVILQLLTTWQQEQIQDSGKPDPSTPPKPQAAVYKVTFDEATNPQILSAYGTAPQSFSAPGGTLTQTTTVSGQQVSQAVVVNAAGLFYQLYATGEALKAKLQNGVSPTPQELATLLAGTFRANGITYSG